jgi:hypothetical protein
MLSLFELILPLNRYIRYLDLLQKFHVVDDLVVLDTEFCEQHVHFFFIEKYPSTMKSPPKVIVI